MRQGRIASRLQIALAAAAFAFPLAVPANAHPHVWITVESTVLYEQGSIVGLRHKWTFDDMYATMATQGLDTNNNGIYERDELAELAKVNVEGLKEFSYFTQATLAGQSLSFDEVRDYYLEFIDAPAGAAGAPGGTAGAQPGAGVATGDTVSEASPSKRKLSLYFTLPMKQPVLAEAPDFKFAVSDPTFFIAFELARTDPVKLGAGAPAGCRAVVGADDQDDAKRLGDALARQVTPQAVSFGYGKPVAIVCDSKS